ncbi:MAG TPA: hypothetical protein VFC44_04180 [Candidatus Saccharimonadales bacterium]|nr:hypothetical protein [Candidatus Saccharimonadales bacterium]
MQQIRNTRQLRRTVSLGQNEFKLLLAGGLIYSSKTITLSPNGRFKVVNHIDDTVQRLTGRQFYTKSQSNIGQAMKLGVFIVSP